MNYIICKTEKEKINAIKSYCAAQITEHKRRIEFFEHEKVGSLDYAEEIDECKTRISHFEKIIEIIANNSVMLY